MGHGAWGMGHGALGMGHWALGMGHWLFLALLPLPPLPPLLPHSLISPYSPSIENSGVGCIETCI
jgi:hypothetical protein